MFYLTTHSTHFIYGYMASDIWLRTILIVRKETRCHHIGYSYRLTARLLLYAPSHRQDNTYHSLCYTSCGALAGTRNSSMGPPHEGSIRRPIAPWANTLPLSYVPLLIGNNTSVHSNSQQTIDGKSGTGNSLKQWNVITLNPKVILKKHYMVAIAIKNIYLNVRQCEPTFISNHIWFLVSSKHFFIINKFIFMGKGFKSPGKLTKTMLKSPEISKSFVWMLILSDRDTSTF